MASREEYQAAADAVTAGTANSLQESLNDRMANLAGPDGDRARKARADAGKNARAAKSHFW